MIEENPKLFIGFLSRFSRKTNSTETIDFVLNEFKKPINDGIDIDKLTVLLNSTQTENELIKARVIRSLHIAKQKYE
jgi:hypothetical protein